MMFERFIAQRYIRSKRQTLFINIIMIVSVAGITVGVAALLIVLSVFNGFNKVVTDVLVGFDPHVRVLPAHGNAMRLTDSLQHVLNTNVNVESWLPYVESKALLMAEVGNRVVAVKGVIDSSIGKVSGVKDAIVVGNFELGTVNGLPGIVLGAALADRLTASVGSEISVVSPAGIDAMLIHYSQPEMRKFVVTGVYDSRNKEYDAHYAFVDLDIARRLFRLHQLTSGIEIRSSDITQSEILQASLQQRLGDRVKVVTWYDLHKDLYSVMQIERWSAYIILCLIIGVAAFNMLGSLTMGVIEKRRDIGVLKSLGASNKNILRLFMFEGLLVGVTGTILGVITGLIVCYLQMTYHLFPLDPRVYIIPSIPVDIRWTDFVAISFASMFLSSLAALYPALRAARLLPVDAIRWE